MAPNIVDKTIVAMGLVIERDATAIADGLARELEIAATVETRPDTGSNFFHVVVRRPKGMTSTAHNAQLAIARAYVKGFHLGRTT